MTVFERVNLKLHTLTVFRGILIDPVAASLLDLCAPGLGTSERMEAYCAFAAKLYERSENLTRCLMCIVLRDENVYVKKRAAGEPVSETLQQCVLHELKALEEVATLSSGEVKCEIGYTGFLPDWGTLPGADFISAYMKRMDEIKTRGYGLFAEQAMFRLASGGIVPVSRPDSVHLSDLIGYEHERGLVIRNTEALLSGRGAQNVLLYGDAGTGKSSTVKAIANEYFDRGLRLIEVTGKEFWAIPRVAEAVAGNPLKFLLFIDDLSFNEGSEGLGELKAILEGSAEARPENLAVYATSNRRRLVRETFSAREGDDIHSGETREEMGSLSARFGISVGFFKPDKAQYLKIVRSLKERYGLDMEDEALELEAERFGLRGRSPRAAKQLVEQLLRRDK